MNDEINKQYVELAAAILKQAANDYIFALRSGNEKKCFRLERWFRSSYGQIISMGNGDAIIRECRRIARESKCDTMTQK